jgi:predicted heme/steroid binding protein
MVISSRLLALVLLAIPITRSIAVRVVTEEELATKTTKTGDIIWLSIMGEVYDVSAGRQYYEDGHGYSVFAGRDGSVPFVTGKFNPEEAAVSIETLTPEQIGTVNEWREFYEKEEKYPFLGVLEGYLYDSEGKPTDILKKIEVIAEGEKAVAAEREKERQARIAYRRKHELKEKKAQANKARAKKSEL